MEAGVINQSMYPDWSSVHRTIVSSIQKLATSGERLVGENWRCASHHIGVAISWKKNEPELP